MGVKLHQKDGWREGKTTIRKATGLVLVCTSKHKEKLNEASSDEASEAAGWRNGSSSGEQDQPPEVRSYRFQWVFDTSVLSHCFPSHQHNVKVWGYVITAAAAAEALRRRIWSQKQETRGKEPEL